VYVGNNWFRWRSLRRVLRAMEPVREQVGRIGLVGNGWDRPAPRANPTLPEDAYRTEASYLERLGGGGVAAVPVGRGGGGRGGGAFSRVVYRPLFDGVRLVTCRTFETPAANTIPLFAQEPAFVAEVYGEEAKELVLPEERPEEKVLDLLRRPEHYARVVAGLRR